MIKFTAVSSTRRKNYSGQRMNEGLNWEVSVDKSHIEKIGWPRSTHFTTRPSTDRGYCDLYPYVGSLVPLPKGVHKFKSQDGNRLRLIPYFGDGVYFEKLEPYDPATQLEYHADENFLRVFYPSRLKRFMHSAFKGRSVIGLGETKE